MAQYPEPNQSIPLAASSQPLPQTIIVSYPEKSSRREHFKDRYSFYLGVTLIVGASVAIVTGAIGYWTVGQRFALPYYVRIAYGHYSFVYAWSAPIVYLAGAFGIVASKTKRVGFIITALVFGILSAVFTVPLVGIACWILAEESFSINYYYENAEDEDERGVSIIQTGLAMGVFMFLCGLVDFVCSIILSTLCCAVVCGCTQSGATGGPQDTSQVMFLNAPSGSQMVTNPQSGAMFVDQTQAVGGDLPPPYSTSTTALKVRPADEEAAECPTKALCP